MYRAPWIDPSQLHYLAGLVGGRTAACKLLNISERTMRRWHVENAAPQMALALLWHAGPLGRAEAEIDLFNELQVQRGLADALKHQLQSDATRVFAESAAAAALDVAQQRIAELEAANEELRELLRGEGLTAELWAMRDRVDRLLGRINTAEVIDWTTLRSKRAGRTGTGG